MHALNRRSFVSSPKLVLQIPLCRLLMQVFLVPVVANIPGFKRTYLYPAIVAYPFHFPVTNN